MTLQGFSRKFESVPVSTSWYLADLGEARGKQELFTRQSPQHLNVLRENALIESTVSSNRIEGIEIDSSRIATVVFGHPILRDRDEEEVRGYRQALTWIHDQSKRIPLSEDTLLQLHRLTRGDIWDSGNYKEKDGDIIEKFPDGRIRVRFRTVSATDTPSCMTELVKRYHDAIDEHNIHPLVLLAAFNLDFLCILPVSERQRPCFKTLFASAMLPPGIRSRALYQPGKTGRTEQRPVLRNPGAKFPQLARW